METQIQKPSPETTTDQSGSMVPPSAELQSYAAQVEGTQTPLQPESANRDAVNAALIERFQGKQAAKEVAEEENQQEARFNNAVHNAVRIALKEQGLVDPMEQRLGRAVRVFEQAPVATTTTRTQVQPGRLRPQDLGRQK